MTPYAPQAPQFQQQQPGQPHVIDASLGEILRAVVHIVAKDMHSDFLDRVARFEDPHALLQVLHEYNNANEAKIQRREHLQKAPAAPNGPRPKMPNGKVVRSKRLARLGQSLSKLWAKGASNTLTLRRNFMSRDNATKFESWNIKNEANRDTRHWDPQSSQQIQDYF